ncbi:protein-glutamate O-methyltransferase CheR [Aliikangiella marina]|uniref:Chemotaxis protein methyltransferase n=1 Tax=Aliikangiella marina TaxID=1712262 RepID=A0A545TDS3_9GAMM|nr:protein-glutamate O-methyltransferase CheR [Aliikangiella marina]TQV75341.1 protein-glutamate O-methyltransferase CheR [Aliikangiella marina]
MVIETGHRREFDFSDENFRHVRALINQLAGITLSERKTDMVYARLARRLRALGYSDFDSYLAFVENDEHESVHFTNSLTTNLTHFFRESHHFDYLADVYFPEILSQGKKRIRIWSAGCSTGEEPYSLAITWRSRVKDAHRYDFKILATDLDTNVLDVCRQGLYAKDKVMQLDDEYQQWFRATKRCNSQQMEVFPKLREQIVFKQLNLMDEWPIKGPLDVIICRNVLIYFDKPTQQKLVNRFAQLLSDRGCLILGHSENLSANKNMFESIGQTTFRKS